MPDYDFVGSLFSWDTVTINATSLLECLRMAWGMLGDIWITLGTFTFNLRDGSVTILVGSAIIEFFSRVLGLKVGVDMGEARIVD